jgi:hypothetical protein
LRNEGSKEGTELDFEKEKSTELMPIKKRNSSKNEEIKNSTWRAKS